MARYVGISTDITNKIIQGGPWVWDSFNPAFLPSGQNPLLESDALSQGYTYPQPSAAVLNQVNLQQKALGALARNSTFLGIVSPTNAQIVTQVNSLTRQINAIIRLLLNQTDDTSGT